MSDYRFFVLQSHSKQHSIQKSRETWLEYYQKLNKRRIAANHRPIRINPNIFRSYSKPKLHSFLAAN